MSLLKINNLTKRFGGVVAVKDLTMEVAEGEIAGLIGPNGAGKSTVFNCISRYYEPTAGDIKFAGESLLDKKPHQIIDKGISRSFQDLELFPLMSVKENLLIGEHRAYQSGVLKEMFNLIGYQQEENESEQKAEEILNFLGLSEVADSMVQAQSFGIRKLVEIGRGLMADPDLLLLDEPVAGLNSEETERLAEVITDISIHQDISVLLVEHDMSFVMDLCDRITVINGDKIAVGTPEEIQNNPEVIEAYLGEENTSA